MILSFTFLVPFQVFLLYSFFDSFLRTLIHEEIITKETAAGGGPSDTLLVPAKVGSWQAAVPFTTGLQTDC